MFKVHKKKKYPNDTDEYFNRDFRVFDNGEDIGIIFTIMPSAISEDHYRITWPNTSGPSPHSTEYTKHQVRTYIDRNVWRFE